MSSLRHAFPTLKRHFTWIKGSPLFASLGLVCCLFLLPETADGKIEIRVAPDGQLDGSGTAASPQSDIATAQRKIRELRRLEDPAIADGAEIILEGGTYFLKEPLFFRPEDAGTAESPTIIRAAEGAHPILSGGIELTGWEKVKGRISGLPDAAVGKVWVADGPVVGGYPVRIRNLWIGDQRGIRAREADGVDFERILEWDKANRVAWIPLPKQGNLEHPGQMEMVIHQMWAIAILRIKSIEPQADRARVTFHEPESRIQFEHPWPPVVISDSGNSAFYLANALEFLDQPGEWYQATPDGRIYYWPREDESFPGTAVIAPVHETLVAVKGTLDQPVEHVHFEGIQFSHSTWMRPSQAGHVPLQAGMYLLDAYKLKIPGTPDKKGLENQAWIGRKPAAVQLDATRNVRFHRCRFEHLAASGLDIRGGSEDDAVIGCLFRDIGGNGLVAGGFQESGLETHVPYEPGDIREMCRRLTISNNLVTNVANDDWGCVGIIAGYVQDINITHNVVNDVSYTGISLGWGWTKSVNSMRDNRVHANHIHHFGKNMYDTGGIYTLSPQPKSMITENCVHSIYRPDYVHDPKHWSYIYLDEGSSFMIIKDNWTEGIKYSTNANGPGNTWENNGPEVDAAIKDRAGLEESYKDLLQYAAIRPDDPVE